MNSSPSAVSQRLPDETVPVIPPVPAAVFEKRARRLRVLASGHAAGEYLDAMAQLADAQLAAARVLSANKKRRPGLSISFNARNHWHGKPWHEALRVIVGRMRLASLPPESQATLSRLEAAAPADLEHSAQAILSGNYDAVDLAASPFLAAALQVYWTHLASESSAEGSGRSACRCPVCASPPVAGVILSGRKLRYLCCSLCSTHWYVPRLICTYCGSTAGLSYFLVDGDESKTKAEACSRCRTYLKLLYLESNPEAEAFADDLATLALDLLMSDTRYSPSGINLFLLSHAASGERGPGAPHSDC